MVFNIKIEMGRQRGLYKGLGVSDKQGKQITDYVFDLVYKSRFKNYSDAILHLESIYKGRELSLAIFALARVEQFLEMKAEVFLKKFIETL